jgi:hypothetical protein
MSVREMVEEPAPEELATRLAELERLHAEGSISDIAYNLRRNLLISRSDELTRRRAVARITPVPLPVAPPARHTRRGLEAEPERSIRGFRRVVEVRSDRSFQGAGRGLEPATQSDRPSTLPPLPPPQLDDRPPQLANRPPRRPDRQTQRSGRPPRRHWRTAGPWLAGVVVIAGAGLLAYQLIGSARPADPATAARATPSAAPATPVSQGNGVAASSPAAGTGAASGQTKAAPGGGTITLAAYQSDLASIEGANPPTAAGESFAAVEVRVCAGSGAPTSVNPFDFVLLEPSGTAVDTLDGLGEGMQPELALSEVPPGQCVSGWLSYEVPSAPLFLSDTAGGLTWALG